MHDQDMNYYQENYNYYNSNNGENTDIDDFNHRSMLGQIDEPNENDFDPEYDFQVNKLLQEVEEDILLNGDIDPVEPKNEKLKDNYLDPVKEKYEDYYDEFPEDDVEETPEWYEEIIQKKVNETKKRLENLSTLVCYASITTREKIRRIEQDHNTPFCKLDFPRHPPLSKPWLNYWRFNCINKCKVDPPEPGHAHTSNCEILLLEHVNSGISTRSKNIFPSEFPEHVMHAVQVFQEFAAETSKILYDEVVPDTIYEKPIWSYIKIRSNYKNELMLIVCGKGISPLLNSLKKYFSSGPGRSCNVVSLYCINVKWSQKKHQYPPSFLYGSLELRDKIGPISINYNPKTNINFNSIEAQQLGKIMLEYLSPTPETTVIDLGCHFGVIGLMLAQKSDKVIGLNTLDHEIKMAEEVKSYNGIHNASFIVCNPKEVHTKCSSLVKKCISVAILNLATPFGKNYDVMKCLRNLPSIWRVVVYGSFARDYHKYITVLTSKDENLGDEFLPMQGCVLDKSPSNPSLFDVIVLFERKSLIEPPIELIASGPTVNVKSDVFKASHSVIFEKTVKQEKDDVKCENRLKNSIYRPFNKFGRPSKKFGDFDSPYLPMEKEVKPQLSSVSKENSFDSLSLPSSKNNSFSCKPVAPLTSQLKIKDLKKLFDCPSLPKSKEKQHDVSSLPQPKEKQFDHSPMSESHKNQSSYPLLTVKKLEHLLPAKQDKQSNCSISITQKNDMDEKLTIKQEHFNIKFESVQVKNQDCEKEEGELSPDSSDNELNNYNQVVIKSESLFLENEKESNDIVSNALIKCEAISTDSDSQPLPEIKIKTEPVDSSEVDVKNIPEICIKKEPVDFKISSASNLDEFENMVTPVHNTVAFENRVTPSPPPLSTNFTTIDGFEFSVKPNQSFLSYKLVPNTKAIKQDPTDNSKKLQKLTTSIKEENNKKSIKNKIEDDEISIIDAKIKKNKKLTVKEEKKINEFDIDINSDEQADLRKLIEKRKVIQQKLDREREYRKFKRHYDRSPSSVESRYRSSLSPSEIRYRSSPSPSNRRFRSPLSPSNRRFRSPLSPIERRQRSPPSPRYRWTISPTRSYKRHRSSFSPINKYYKKSPSSPKYKRSPSSPTEKRYLYKKRNRSKSWSRSKSRSRSRSRSRSPSVSVSPSEKKRIKSPLSHRRRSRSNSKLRSNLKSPKTSPDRGRRSAHKQSSSSSNKKRKTSPDTVTNTSSNDKCKDFWDIPGISSFKRNSEKIRFKNEKSTSPTSSISSDSLSSSIAVKQESS